MTKVARNITQPTPPPVAPQEPATEASTAPAAEASPAEQPAPEEPAHFNPNLAGKFELVGTEPGLVVTATHRTIDLRTISAEVAEELVASGKFQYLVRIPTKD